MEMTEVREEAAPRLTFFAPSHMVHSCDQRRRRMRNGEPNHDIMNKSYQDSEKRHLCGAPSA